MRRVSSSKIDYSLLINTEFILTSILLRKVTEIAYLRNQNKNQLRLLILEVEMKTNSTKGK